jgi:hypothetical protein
MGTESMSKEAVPADIAQRALDELAGICAAAVLPVPWAKANALLTVLAQAVNSGVISEPDTDTTGPSIETPMIGG